jgi:hypothetical protein
MVGPRLAVEERPFIRDGLSSAGMSPDVVKPLASPAPTGCHVRTVW